MDSTREEDDRCTCGVLIAEHREVSECAGDPRWPERTEKEIERKLIAEGARVDTAPAGVVCLTCHPELLPPDFDPVALVRAADEARDQRAAEMPDTAAALGTLLRAWQRLKELGWREAIYAPTDGTRFLAIEAGSTGVHRCYRDRERRFWIEDGDTWPSSPILWRPLDPPSTGSDR